MKNLMVFIALIFLHLPVEAQIQSDGLEAEYKQNIQFRVPGNRPVIQRWKLIYQRDNSSYTNLQQEDYKPVFKDFKTDSLYSVEWNHVKGSYLYIQESKYLITWHFLEGDSTISTYSCKRATAFVRGRRYEAWFTPDIPISDGPWKLYGLPGLILAATDSTGEVHFSVEKISKNHIVAAPKRILLPLGKKYISKEDYLHILRTDLKNFMVLQNSNREGKSLYVKGTTSTVSIQPTGIEILPLISAQMQH